jgi:hypothetical protein
MSTRLSPDAKRIKSLMIGAGIARPEGKTCYSLLKHLKAGAMIAAFKDGAIFFWENSNSHYEDLIDRLNVKPKPVCFLYMTREENIISLSDYLVCDIIRQWRGESYPYEKRKTSV